MVKIAVRKKVARKKVARKKKTAKKAVKKSVMKKPPARLIDGELPPYKKALLQKLLARKNKVVVRTEVDEDAILDAVIDQTKKGLLKWYDAGQSGYASDIDGQTLVVTYSGALMLLGDRIMYPEVSMLVSSAGDRGSEFYRDVRDGVFFHTKCLKKLYASLGMPGKLERAA